MIDRSGRRLQNAFVAFVFIIFCFNYVHPVHVYQHVKCIKINVNHTHKSPRFFFRLPNWRFQEKLSHRGLAMCIVWKRSWSSTKRPRIGCSTRWLFFFSFWGCCCSCFFFQTAWRSCFLVFLEGVSSEIPLGIVGFWWIVTVGWLGVNSLESP